MERRLSFVVVLLLLGALFSVSSFPGASAAPNYTYSAVLIQPAPGAPAITTPGSTITLVPKSGVQITGLEIISILHGPYTLQILGDENGTITAKVPDDVVPDDYFLIVNTSSGQTIIPNGVYVLKKFPDVLNIVQVSDTHITSGAKIGYVCGDYFQRNIFKLDEMCSNPIPLHSATAADSAYTYWSMNPNVTLMINTGDDVDTAGDYAGYKVMLDIMERTSAAGRLVVNIKGNHDDPPVVFQKLIGPRYFYETIGKFLIIGLDSRGDEGHPELGQLEWMERVLEQHPNYTKIILVHHPFWYSGSLGNHGGYVNGSAFDDNSWNALLDKVSWYWSGGADHPTADIARRFLEDVEKYNVALIMSGHIHNDKTVIYTDTQGHVHWFATLTATGAPDKETNPPSKPGRNPTWYGSNLITIYANGTVEMKPVMKTFGTVFGNFTSLPVPQRFIVFRHNGEDGTALKVINTYKPVSGKLALVVPEGASVDPSATNITYTVLGERTIGDKHYMLLNVTIPIGTWQIVASKGADSEKPVLKIAYTSPSRPRPGRPFKLYLSATDNIGVRDMYAVIYDKSTGKEVSYGKVSKFPAEPTSGKEDNKYYVFQFPALNQSNYEIKVIATDFYNNTAEATKEINFTPATTTTATTTTSSSSTTTTTTTSTTSSSSTTTTTTTTSSSSSSTSSTSSTTQSTTTTSSAGQSSSSPQPATSATHKGTSICGPAAILGLAIVPLLLRKRK